MMISTDEFQVIEMILSLYPDICRAAEQRRDYVISLALSSPSSDGIHVQGGERISVIERFVEGDKETNDLKTIIARVHSCVSRLRQEERKFVTEYYIEKKDLYDFDESSSVIYGKRRKICGKLSGVLKVYPLVRAWRTLEAERRLEATRRQSKAISNQQPSSSHSEQDEHKSS